MKTDRRRFLGVTAGIATGVAAGVPASRTLSELIAAVDSPVYPAGGAEDIALSVCGMCGGGCGVRVRRVGGRAVKLDGNPLHPINRGRLCPRGQAALQGLYHPDRFQGPLRRVGAKGSLESFEPATWSQALAAIAGSLRELRTRPQSLALLRGSPHGLAAGLARRLLATLGSPHDVAVERGEAAESLALEAGQGLRVAPAYDIRSADYVLSFGNALLEAAASPVHASLAYGELRQGHAGRRGKLVQVEPRLSITGGSADEWIPVRPGTEGLLALAICQVLVSEGLYDRSFVSRRVDGFEDRQDAQGHRQVGLRSFLARHVGLERASAECGVAVNVILRLARELAEAANGIALGPRRGPNLPGRLADHLAVQALNALLGRVDAPGGVLIAEATPLTLLATGPTSAQSSESSSEPSSGPSPQPMDAEQLADVVLDDDRPPIEMLLVLGTDPVYRSLSRARLTRALERIPLVVSFASLPDDTAPLADWILPDAHPLESWRLEATPPGVAYSVLSLSQPAIEPYLDVRPSAEVLLELAHGDEALRAAFPWQDVPELLRQQVDILFASRRGTIMGTVFDESWVRMMERAGWWDPGYGSASELWRRMLETGGWWDPFYDHRDWARVLDTDSGRFELRAERMAELVSAGAVADAEPPERGLSLVLFEPLPIAGGSGAELPFLMAILDPELQEGWETWAEIHPATAARLGLADRAWVEIRSDAGAIEARARVTYRIVEDAVAVPLGLGRSEGGRWARGRGSRALDLVALRRDPASGLPDLHHTRVTIRPASASRRQGEA